MTDPNQAIYARVAKLLALANNEGATEAEAALAAEHVQRLLQEYNLTLSQVEAKQDDHTTAKRDKTLTERTAAYEWQVILMRSLAENNFCLHTTRTATVIRSAAYGAERCKRHLLVGRPLNIAVAVDTYDYLLAALKRAAAAAGYPWHRRTRELNWFLEGAAGRLAERLAEQRRAAEQDQPQPPTTNGRELVLSDVYGSEADLNNDALNGYPAGTTAANARKAAARRASQEAEHDRLVAAGIPDTEAWYRAFGYGEDRAKEMAQSWNRSHRNRRSTSWTNNDREHSRKINSEAYSAGKQAGAEIGLDKQVGQSTQRRLPQ